MPETPERLEALERDVQTLRPDIPRFGAQDFDRRVGEVVDELQAEFLQRISLSTQFTFSSLVATLPATGVRNGAMAFATDGRKQGEAAGAGTGVPVYYDGTTSSWRVYSDDSEVSA